MGTYCEFHLWISKLCVWASFYMLNIQLYIFFLTVEMYDWVEMVNKIFRVEDKEFTGHHDEYIHSGWL